MNVWKIIRKISNRLSEAISFTQSVEHTTITEESKKKKIETSKSGDFIDPYPKMSKEEFEQGKKEVMAVYNGLDHLFKSALSDMEKIHRG